jgi:hypothetical protein
MKRFLNSVASGVAFALAALITSALALTILGRESSNYRNIQQAGISAVSTDQGVTATPSGTQVNSYQITAGFTTVTTVATIGDGVKLPSLTNLYSPSNLDASLNVIIVNNSGNSMNVFPFAATDVIVSGGAAAGAGAAMAVGALRNADCWSSATLGRWYCTIG